MEKISQSIVDFIRRNMTIDDDEMLYVYKYGIEITLSSLINFIIIIVCSLVVKDLAAGFIFMACFILIRSYTGGYHAETYWRCNMAFMCTFVLTYCVSKLFDYMSLNVYIVAVLLVFGIVPIIKLAPVKNRHKFLSESKRKKSRVISLILYTLFSVVSIVLCEINIQYGYLILTTILSVSILILVEVFMQSKGYHVSNN